MQKYVQAFKLFRRVIMRINYVKVIISGTEGTSVGPNVSKENSWKQ